MTNKLQKGDRVMVRNVTAGGKSFNEGVAKLLEFRRRYECGGEMWMVRFSDGDEVLRTVYFEDKQESKK